MNNRIAIIGAGQLGSRHLQALALMKDPAEIWVVDPSETSLATAAERWKEVAAGKENLVQFVKSISDLPGQLDVVIVASNSLVRRSIIESLLKEKNVRFLVLEKVLFPSIEDYTAVEKLLAEKNVKAWVNCPRRQYPGYRFLKEDIREQSILMTVAGSGWGLACNSIHWIDIFSFISNNDEMDIISLLDEQPVPSKRAGYTEFTGTLLIKNSSGSKLLLHCFADGSNELESHIELPTSKYHIREAIQQLGIRKEENGWENISKQFPVLRQSQLTNLFVEELLDSGNCSLTTYNESMQLHLPLLKVLLEHYNTFQKTPGNKLCPIT